jgi:hypothetical protein
LKKPADHIVGVRSVVVVGQRFAKGNNRVVSSNLDMIGGRMDEVRSWSIRAGEFQQLDRSIDACYVESGLDECFRQRSGATAHVHYSSDLRTGTSKLPHNFARRTPCKGSKRCCLNIREITLVDRLHPADSLCSVCGLQFGMNDGNPKAIPLCL